MNNTQKKVRLKRVEKFGDALAGGLAAAGMGMLGIVNGIINIAHITFSAVLLVAAIAIYSLTTWIAIELAKDIKDVDKGDDG